MTAKYFDVVSNLLELVLRLGIYIAVGIGNSEQMEIFLAIGSLKFAVFVAVVAKRRQFCYAGILLLDFEMAAIVLQNEVACNSEQSCKSKFVGNMLAYVFNALINGIILHYVALLVAVGETELALALDFHLFHIDIMHLGILLHWRRQGNLDEGIRFKAFANKADKFFHSERPLLVLL